MTACERGVWIDTEGYLRSTPAILEVTQKERKPLEDYCAGAMLDGILCKIYRTPEAWGAYITGIENIAREIKITQPFIRTKTRKKQIWQFKRHIIRSQTSESKKARDILNV